MNVFSFSIINSFFLNEVGDMSDVSKMLGINESKRRIGG